MIKTKRIVDDTKLENKAHTKDDCLTIQKYLDISKQRLQAQEIDFNMDKRKVIEIGDENTKHEY